jgi:glycosyltransferase involved in cell wall biosynthesis/GT2 family glycosyltransferase
MNQGKEILISLIVPVYNALEFLQEMYASLLPTLADSYQWELIFVDNNSDIETKNFLHTIKDKPQHTCIFNSVNKNFSGACNVGSHHARGRYLIFVNTDLIFTNNWLTPLISIFEKDSSVSVVGNLHLFPETLRVHHAGIFLNSDMTSHHHLLNCDIGDPRVRKTRELDAVNGALFAVKSEEFKQRRGFDETFINGCEEIDFCLRCKVDGLKVVYTSESVVFHHGQKSPGRNDNNERNIKHLHFKWNGKYTVLGDSIHEQDCLVLQEEKTAKKTKRVGYISTYNQYCGIALYTEKLRNAHHIVAIERGEFEQDSVVFAEKKHKPRLDDDPFVVRCWLRSEEDIVELYQAIVDYRCTEIHLQYQWGLFNKHNLKHLFEKLISINVTITVTFHSYDEGLEEISEWINLPHKLIVHLSQAKHILVSLGAEINKIEFSPHPTSHAWSPSKNYARKILNLPQEASILASVGFFEPHKGIYEIISSVAETIKKHDNLLFIHIGAPHPDNPIAVEYFNSCKKLVSAYGLENKFVLFDSFLDEKTASYLRSASDIIILNYKSERLEASGAASDCLAHEKPTIVSERPAFKELSNYTLTISEKFNISQLVELLLKSNNLKKYLSEEAVKFKKEHSYTSFLKKILDKKDNSNFKFSYKKNSSLEINEIVIGFDVRCLESELTAPRGIGRYAQYHINSLLECNKNINVNLYCAQESSYISSFKKYRNVKIRPYNNRLTDKLDYYHIHDPMSILPNLESPFKSLPNCPISITFHDLIPIIKSEYHFDHWNIEMRSEYQKRLTTLDRLPITILANSQSTKNDLLTHTNILSEKIIVVGAGVCLARTSNSQKISENFNVKEKFSLKNPYFLALGGLDMHKGFSTTVLGFAQLCVTQQAQLLVIGSELDVFKQHYKQKLSEAGLTNISFTGFLSELDLETLLRNAVALCFPSEYEGFGLPVAEAMFCGCPVITTRCGALEEVGGKDALYIEPKDSSQMKSAMELLLLNSSERSIRSVNGKKQAEQFQWKYVAKKTLEIWSKSLNDTSQTNYPLSKQEAPYWLI